MTSPVVTVAGMELLEIRSTPQSEGVVSVAGRDWTSRHTAAEVRAIHDNVNQLLDRTVPVLWDRKTQHNGFYRVTGASSVLTDVGGGDLVISDWQLTLERIGSSRDVEIESRVPTIPRLDELTGTQTPSYWHAPAVGFTSYWTGSTVPAGSVSRVSSDGTVTVHTGIPTSVAPRWTVPVESYLLGSSRILLDGIRRVGTHTPPHTSWELHNGLVRVAGAASGAVTVSAWDSGVWASAKGYQFTATSALTTTPEVSILRNDPEECAVRLSYATAVGRVTVDLSLRRGSRFVTGVVKRHSAATLGVVRTAAEAATAVTGGLYATAADADGNRFVMGSTRTVTAATGTAAISKASVTSFDFFLGHEFGATPATGDAFADLLAQYIASSGERVRVVRR